jgi:hypothetical protein
MGMGAKFVGAGEIAQFPVFFPLSGYLETGLRQTLHADKYPYITIRYRECQGGRDSNGRGVSWIYRTFSELSPNF